MTLAKFTRAQAVIAEVSALESEIAAWEYGAHEKVQSPLKFRTSGHILERVPERAFADFKSACLTSFRERITKLREQLKEL